MDTYRMHVQYTTYVDIEAENLDDPQFEEISNYISDYEEAINTELSRMEFVKCDSAIWVEPVDAYIPVEITKKQANRLLEWLNGKKEREDEYDYLDLEAMGYKVANSVERDIQIAFKQFQESARREMLGE